MTISSYTKYILIWFLLILNKWCTINWNVVTGCICSCRSRKEGMMQFCSNLNFRIFLHLHSEKPVGHASTLCSSYGDRAQRVWVYIFKHQSGWKRLEEQKVNWLTTMQHMRIFVEGIIYKTDYCKHLQQMHKFLLLLVNMLFPFDEKGFVNEDLLY